MRLGRQREHEQVRRSDPSNTESEPSRWGMVDLTWNIAVQQDKNYEGPTWVLNHSPSTELRCKIKKIFPRKGVESESFVIMASYTVNDPMCYPREYQAWHMAMNNY